ncbi:hypothetical protein RIF29_05298 [Crotalaria pallida]|uniref:Uncharacterized protein n=1 Tax=Crotalaria pallida TaxID=3830 RepID=A0AAN9J2Y7_CROPI
MSQRCTALPDEVWLAAFCVVRDMTIVTLSVHWRLKDGNRRWTVEGGAREGGDRDSGTEAMDQIKEIRFRWRTKRPSAIETLCNKSLLPRVYNPCCYYTYFQPNAMIRYSVQPQSRSLRQEQLPISNGRKDELIPSP